MKKIILLLLIPWALTGCSSDSTTQSDDTESAQQLGDTMASVDEAGGTSGAIAYQHSIEKMFRRVSPKDLQGHTWRDFLIQPAYAGCFDTAQFSACLANTKIRNFDDCRIGPATFNGTVTLVWGGTSMDCRLEAVGDTITRSPDFTITGLFGGKYTVSKTGTIGQRLTWTSGSGTDKVFDFTNDGIRREFTFRTKILFDFTNETTDAITITGTTRAHRVINGGTLKVTNNKTSVSCDYTPTNITWNSATCNCPVSGSWSGTCSNGKTKTLEITGCGTATLTVDGVTSNIDFDRCESE